LDLFEILFRNILLILLFYTCSLSRTHHTMASSESNVVTVFQDHIETCEILNNFKEFWHNKWKGITQKCLNVARHEFVMRKSFEMFASKRVMHAFTNKPCDFDHLFVENHERAILKGLCVHVGLDYNEFIFLGLNFHRNRCRKHCRTKL